jgi:hypothetical protein
VYQTLAQAGMSDQAQPGHWQLETVTNHWYGVCGCKINVHQRTGISSMCKFSQCATLAASKQAKHIYLPWYALFLNFL